MEVSDRRVTRAMAKTVANSANSNTTITRNKGGSTAAAVIISKKKTITHKRNGAINSTKDQNGIQASSKAIKKGITTKGPDRPKSSAATPSLISNDKKDAEVQVVVLKRPEPLTAPVPTERNKKLKPQAIDHVYTEYNALFSEACSKLTTYAKYWRNVVEGNSSIPEDVKDDIVSALGKVKLLLDSKLPQFGQLLYAYLSKEKDPALILECDLQGWWDVAYIQVSAVYTEFEKLKELEARNWTAVVESLPRAPLKKKSIVNEAKPSPRMVAVKPSQGLRAFLAMKRKENKGGTDVIPTEILFR